MILLCRTRDPLRRRHAEPRCSRIGRMAMPTLSGLNQDLPAAPADHAHAANAGHSWPDHSATGPVRLHRRGSRPMARHSPCSGCATADRPTVGLRDPPRQPRRLRGRHPPQRIPRRHPRRSPRLRLRSLPQRPHRLDLTPDELTGVTTSHATPPIRPNSYFRLSSLPRPT